MKPVTKMIARVPTRTNRGFFPKEIFEVDLEAMTCICPTGQITNKLASVGGRKDRHGQTYPQKSFRFDGQVCDACSLRAQCVRAGPGEGRTVSLHSQERLLQEARAFQNSTAFREYQELRQAAEHRLARMVQLGVRQARYFGRTGTLFQALMASMVANFTLIARKTGEMDIERSAKADLRIFFSVEDALWSHD